MADPSPRTWFGATVLAGVATSALTALASAKPWMTLDVPAGMAPGVPESARTADLPLALALSLVVLAGWGAILVSQGGFRRVVSAVGAVAALGVVACYVVGPFVLPGDLRDQVATSKHWAVSPTGWFVVGAVAAAASLAVLAAAWRLLPRWPTMSARYDAPGTRAEVADRPRSDTDLWKALDAGHDPTDPADPAAS